MKAVTINPGPVAKTKDSVTDTVRSVTVDRIATLVIVLVVVIVGGMITIVHPATLSFSQYIRDVSVGGGLLGVGLGIDRNSKP